jgi:acyl carrier protein
LSTERASAAAYVREALDFLWPGRFDDAIPLRNEESLGASGLGLDSIEIVELVLACQSQAGLHADRAEELLDSGPLTIGGLIAHLAQT